MSGQVLDEVGARGGEQGVGGETAVIQAGDLLQHGLEQVVPLLVVRGLVGAAAPGLFEGERERAVVEFEAQDGVQQGGHAGPGQPAAIHRDGLTFRPDWENVTGPVPDFLTRQPGVDPGRIALPGVSLGGYLAPRAAAYEPRLAAAAAVDGVFDAASALTAHLPLPHHEAVRRAAAEHDQELDQMIAKAREHSPTLRRACDHGRYVTGTSTGREFLATYARYNLSNGSAQKITCPVLVCEATADLFYTAAGESDPRKLYRHLTTSKKLLSFTQEEGGDTHCHPGALRLAVARIFDWLDDTI